MTQRSLSSSEEAVAAGRHIATHVTKKAHLLAVIPLAVARQTVVAVVSATAAVVDAARVPGCEAMCASGRPLELGR